VERYQRGEFSGSIVLENALRRRAIITVEATYDGEGEGLKVTSVSARTVVPLLLTVDTFLVPTAKAENVLDAPTLTEMFIRMAEVVAPIDQVDAFGGDYTIFAAVRERLDPGQICDLECRRRRTARATTWKPCEALTSRAGRWLPAAPG
jgi:hypothetical protein